MRSDGLEKIGYMLLGNIRYRYTAKDRAKEQGIEYLVYLRFTRVAYPRSQEMHINDAYMLIKDNEVRNEQIVADVKKCINNGRTPVVLTRYKEHASLLSERMQVRYFFYPEINRKRNYRKFVCRWKKYLLMKP